MRYGFNKHSIKEELRPRLKAALSLIEEDLGISIRLGPCRFTPRSAYVKLICEIEGDVVDERKLNFQVFCKDFGFEEEHLEKHFMMGNEEYEVYGLNPRARKYPIVCRRFSDDKFFKMKADHVKALLEEKS